MLKKENHHQYPFKMNKNDQTEIDGAIFLANLFPEQTHVLHVLGGPDNPDILIASNCCINVEKSIDSSKIQTFTSNHNIVMANYILCFEKNNWYLSIPYKEINFKTDPLNINQFGVPFQSDNKNVFAELTKRRSGGLTKKNWIYNDIGIRLQPTNYWENIIIDDELFDKLKNHFNTFEIKSPITIDIKRGKKTQLGTANIIAKKSPKWSGNRVYSYPAKTKCSKQVYDTLSPLELDIFHYHIEKWFDDLKVSHSDFILHQFDNEKDIAFEKNTPFDYNRDKVHVNDYKEHQLRVEICGLDMLEKHVGKSVKNKDVKFVYAKDYNIEWEDF